MKRNDIPINDYAIRQHVNAGITYSLHYAQVDACIAAGLNLYDWETGKIPNWIKAEVVAWHIAKSEIENHIQDAQNKAIDKMRKKK